jgi:hypothetical protein
MKSYSLSHLADGVLMRDLRTLVTQDRVTTAELLAHLAEVEERRLYRPEGCASMFAYCVQELRMSEDMALKRIRVTRAARQFQGIFPALADGRLTLSAVLMLKPYLRPETAAELLSAAVHKTNAEIELLLARRFPQADVPTLVQAVTSGEVAVRPVGTPTPEPAPGQAAVSLEVAVRPVGTPTPQLTPGQLAATAPAPRTRVAPLAPERFALQVTINGRTHELLRRAQALLGHAVPAGDVAQVLERALGELVERLEKRKFAKSDRPRPGRSGTKGRYVPAAIRRAVWQRDGGRCTFVSESGKRCEERSSVEFDHVDPVARGGEATVGRVRLRCRAHNQYAAECVFGKEFMRGKREQARTRSFQAQAHAAGSPP